MAGIGKSDVVQAGRGDAQACGCTPVTDTPAIARKQLIEFARALARLAAQEDDAAEREEAGRKAAQAGKSVKSVQRP
jgi:hypothetical protein